MNALFLHDRNDLEAEVAGGVQICTREFLAIVRAAAESTMVFPVETSRHWLDRLQRKLRIQAYRNFRPDDYKASLRSVVASGKITHAFLNRSELIRFGELLKQIAPQVKVVVMSHGNQSGDDLYEVSGPAGRRSAGWARWQATWTLGLDLVTESSARHRTIDAMVVMSREEAVMERWLGASQVVVLPRLLHFAPLERTPSPGKVGYVGTLDHTPNLVALEAILEELARRNLPDLEIRLVGSPEHNGHRLAAQYPFITYLGRLNDDALQREASTWELFLNPIFWLSRGASMKLRTALAWGLPVLTSRSGARGYEWNAVNLPTSADSASDFCDQMAVLLSSPDALNDAAAASRAVVESSPTLDALGRRLRATVDPAALDAQ